MDSEYANRQFDRMEEQIDFYLTGKVGLNSLKEKLWALFTAIEEKDKMSGFVEDFHEQWDALEEIFALEKEEKYLAEIKEERLPKLRALIQKHRS